MKDIYLEGKNTYLKFITYDDTDLMVKWRNQDNVRQYFIYREEFNTTMHEKWMSDKVETGQVVQFTVYDKESDIPIGCTYLRDIDYEKKDAEYGVLIGEESYRGRGVGKEILKLTIEYAFDELKLDTVIARVISTNMPSLYSFLNTGFEITRETTQTTIPDGVVVPVTMLEIKREKYEKN